MLLLRTSVGAMLQAAAYNGRQEHCLVDGRSAGMGHFFNTLVWVWEKAPEVGRLQGKPK